MTCGWIFIVISFGQLWKRGASRFRFHTRYEKLAVYFHGMFRFVTIRRYLKLPFSDEARYSRHQIADYPGELLEVAGGDDSARFQPSTLNRNDPIL